MYGMNLSRNGFKHPKLTIENNNSQNEMVKYEEQENGVFKRKF